MAHAPAHEDRLTPSSETRHTHTKGAGCGVRSSLSCVPPWPHAAATPNPTAHNHICHYVSHQQPQHTLRRAAVSDSTACASPSRLNSQSASCRTRLSMASAHGNAGPTPQQGPTSTSRPCIALSGCSDRASLRYALRSCARVEVRAMCFVQLPSNTRRLRCMFEAVPAACSGWQGHVHLPPSRPLPAGCVGRASQ